VLTHSLSGPISRSRPEQAFDTAAKVAVIPHADAPAPNAQEAAKPAEERLASAHDEAMRNAKVAVLPAANAPRNMRAVVRQASKAVRVKATRAKLRSKANAKRRARR
jgi:hypothetical protein